MYSQTPSPSCGSPQVATKTRPSATYGAGMLFRLHAWQLTYTGTGDDGLTLTKTKTPPCSTRRPPTTLDHGTGVASGPGFHIRWPRTDTWPFRRVSCGMKDPHRPEAYVGRIKFKLTRPGRRCRDGRRMRGLGKCEAVRGFAGRRCAPTATEQRGLRRRGPQTARER